MKIKKIAPILTEIINARTRLKLAEGLRDIALYRIQIERLRTLELKLASCPSYVQEFHVKYGKGHVELIEYVQLLRRDAERKVCIYQVVWI